MYLHFDHFHTDNLLASDPSHSVAAADDDPETKDSGEQGVMVTPKAEDLAEVPIQEAVSLLEIAAQVML